jgi:hypothetical protein
LKEASVDAAAMQRMVAMNGGFAMHLKALADPVERRWLVGRLLNRWKDRQQPMATPVVPPPREIPSRLAWTEIPLTSARPGRVPLPGGRSMVVEQDHSWAGFRFDNAALAAAFHGFAWLAHTPDPVLLAGVWRAWLEAFPAERADQPAWSADIVAERSLALLDAARLIGLPGPKAAMAATLADHAATLLGGAIDPLARPGALARRGHALARLGFDLGMPETARFGVALVLREIDRLTFPSGVTRLGSTHWHLVLCQSLADLFLTARRRGDPQAAALETRLQRALAPVASLTLSGGLPLMGDIAQTLPPGWLDGLVRGNPMTAGWTGRLPHDDRALLARMRDDNFVADLETLRADGWLRVDQGDWSGLWHATPEGWPAWNGFAHQDLGAPELHYRGVPVFLDPGGSPVDDLDGGAACRSAIHHGGLQLDGMDPLPIDRPHYDDAFRRAVAGRPPALAADFDGARLDFGRLAGIAGLREGYRRWHFADGGFEIDDLLNGNGRYDLTRRFITPLAAKVIDQTTVLLEGQGLRFHLSADAPLSLLAGVRWIGYGETRPVQVIEAAKSVNLPWRGRVRVVPA